MNLKTNQKDLLKALVTASKAVPSKAAFPMMENFMLSVADNKLHIYATDGGITVSASIDAEGEGSTCIDAKLLLDAIALLPDGDIEFNVEDRICTIDYGNGKFQLPTFPVEDYPTVDTLVVGSFVTMSCAELKEALAYVSPSISKDTLRPQMCGVFFNPVDGGFDIVATESRTLSIQTVKCEGDKGEEFTLATPAVKFLREQLPNDDTDVMISADESKVSFSFANTVINAVKVQGKFPNYQMVIPTQNENRLTAHTADLLGTVKRISTCSNKASNVIKFTLSTLGGATIEAQDVGFGCSAKETMDDVHYNGEDLVVGFKHDFLSAILGALTETDVTMLFDGPKRAVLVLTDNDSRKAIVMPSATS